MNAVVNVPNQSTALALTAVDMQAHVQRIQQVMKAVMKDGTHYGKIPGAGDKKSLFKAGAEVLCATFHIAPSFRVEDLSNGDSIRYRITCVGTHQHSGTVLGEGLGEASSDEEKYKWRAAVCREEFETSDYDRRRLKWKKSYDKGNPYSIEQVRTEPADTANTVLKMACKRAHVAMTINVTAASDIFTQDLEDMPAELRDGIVGDESPRGKPATKAPQSSKQTGGGAKQHGTITDPQLKLLRSKIDQAAMSAEDICKRYSIESIDKLPFDKMNDALAFIKDPERAAIEAEANGDAN